MGKLNVFRKEEPGGYERFDVCYGVVDCVCRAGAYITLDNNEKAFSYDCASLPIGAKILCTVLRTAQNAKGKRMVVSFDSRLEDSFDIAC